VINMSSETFDTEEPKYVDKNTGRKYKYKLAWCEDEKNGIWNTALGNYYHMTTSGIFIFEGAHGEIVISPQIKYTIK